MLYQIGEKVVFLKEPGGGIITKIDRFKVYVEDETGFERPFNINDIGKIYSNNHDLDLDDTFIEKEKTNLHSKPKKSDTYKVYSNYWEIDLHFEELIDVVGDNLRQNQEQALQKQMAIFRNFFEKAKDKKIRKLIVIHGIGKGILKQELRLFLKGQSGIDFFDAPYSEYGYGATQVEIKYAY